jgi:hypothetical protein
VVGKVFGPALLLTRRAKSFLRDTPFPNEMFGYAHSGFARIKPVVRFARIARALFA